MITYATRKINVINSILSDNEVKFIINRDGYFK